MSVAYWFESVYGRKRNFMTPNIEGYGTATGPGGESLVYELSSGNGIYGNKIYGVTILEPHSGHGIAKRHDLSRGGFKSKDEAIEYIRELSNGTRRTV